MRAEDYIALEDRYNAHNVSISGGGDGSLGDVVTVNTHEGSSHVGAGP